MIRAYAPRATQMKVIILNLEVKRIERQKIVETGIKLSIQTLQKF